jgi:hypothetical protein
MVQAHTILKVVVTVVPNGKTEIYLVIEVSICGPDGHSLVCHSVIKYSLPDAGKDFALFGNCRKCHHVHQALTRTQDFH